MVKKNLKPIKQSIMEYKEFLEDTQESKEIRMRIYNFIISHAKENPKETLISHDFYLTAK